MENLIFDKQKCCCIIGHRKIAKTTELKQNTYTVIENLITTHGVNTFLFGSKSEFNCLCHDIVTCLKEKYPYIQRIYIRAEYADIDIKYKRYLLEKYENTYFPPQIRCAGKASYIERNYEMINKSNFCVMYYDEKYIPGMNRNINNHLNYTAKSGTKIAYDYAVKKGLKIVNTFHY